MKKINFLMILSTFAATAFSQKLKTAQVPTVVISALQKQYANVKADWEKEKEGYEATFKYDGKDMSVIIDKSGTIIETETDIAVSALPSVIESYIKTHYKGQKIKEAAKIVNAKGETNYEAELKGMDLIFDANGKFIKAIKPDREKEEKDDK